MSSQVFLIHGYSTGVKFSFFRKDAVGNGGFTIFDTEIVNKQIHLFRWYETIEEWGFWKSINQLYNINLFFREKKIAQNAITIKKLIVSIHDQQPTIIIAHSLGSRLLFETLNKYKLPNSVKKIVIVNGQLPFNLKLTNSNLIDKIEVGELTMENYFHCWDITLISSIFLTGSIPAGLVGLHSKYVNNYFKFILVWGDWHTALIQNIWLKEKVGYWLK